MNYLMEKVTVRAGGIGLIFVALAAVLLFALAALPIIEPLTRNWGHIARYGLLEESIISVIFALAGCYFVRFILIHKMEIDDGKLILWKPKGTNTIDTIKINKNQVDLMDIQKICVGSAKFFQSQSMDSKDTLLASEMEKLKIGRTTTSKGFSYVALFIAKHNPYLYVMTNNKKYFVLLNMYSASGVKKLVDELKNRKINVLLENGVLDFSNIPGL